MIMVLNAFYCPYKQVTDTPFSSKYSLIITKTHKWGCITQPIRNFEIFSGLPSRFKSGRALR